MLLALSTTHTPATDLGFLLHKNPDRVQTFDLSFGQAHVFYPDASADRCTAVLLLDVDPVRLVRGSDLDRQYVNDRPYVASSFLSVAIAEVFSSALAGRSKERPELAAAPMPLTASLTALPCLGGEALLRRLFEPLGYEVTAESFDRYVSVTLRGTVRLAEFLTHLYVLIPVLDDEKHYFVGDEEVDKLIRRGEGWLPGHPERELIAQRYLKHRRSLVRAAIARLADDEAPETDEPEPRGEEPLNLNSQRLATVLATVRASGAQSVVDLGCGEGKLLDLLLDDRSFERIVGMDVSHRALEIAKDRLRLERLPPKQRERIELLQGSLLYRDARIAGFDAATVVEVIEHLDPPRLAAFERVAFEFARPRTIVVTTPNADYNVRWPSLPAGRFRHKDHRFEWTREQFRGWATGVAERFGYTVRFTPVGPEDAEVGSPTQMGIFTRTT
ncbi:MAG TPA: 3' terminal RNA ribose 2'-O-methyltransferase Hen1 [Gemmatimonadaceae bacterium]|nr:3' terminal RNA ribose 2'-O-methyltransferase Hen1 [Gemmatimonadaceae bacterium]